MRRRGRVLLVRGGLGLLAVIVMLQFLPVGAGRSNPPVVQDAPWPDARARELAVGACYDCHSNQTRWPAYAYVAPFSWLLERDVAQGREALNFSDWERSAGEADKAADEVANRGMPPRRYVPLHPDARLSAAERQVLIDALTALEGARRGRDGGGGSGPG